MTFCDLETILPRDEIPQVPAGREADRPILDEEVILKGSDAEWGYQVGEARGEVFFYPGRGHIPDYIEVYPHDGRDQPIVVDIGFLGYPDDETVTRAIDWGLKVRAGYLATYHG